MAAAMISELENALNCIFDPSTSNEEKKKLEDDLNKFKNQPDSLNICYHLLASSKNQYVLWYAASILEDTVNRKWRFLGTKDKCYLREFVFDQLLTNFYSLPPFVPTKLAKVIVDVGKYDWPHDYPEFLAKLENLVQTRETCRIGLSLLVLLAEEFGAVESPIPVARKTQLQAHFFELNNVIASITTVLSNTQKMINTSNLDSAALQQDDALASLALKALIQFLSWAPIADHLTSHLVTLLFQFAIHPIQRGQPYQLTTSSPAAVEFLTEMMSKHCIPREGDHFLVELTRSLMIVLEALTEQQSNLISSVGEEYLTKVIDLLSAFITTHLPRLVQNPEFPLNYFLQLFLSFTCRQPNMLGFKACMNQWNKFVNFLAEVEHQLEGGKDEAKRAHLEIYENGLCALMLHLVERTKHSMYNDQLSELDDEVEDEYGDENTLQDEIGFGIEEYSLATKHSELQEFIQECVALVARIAEFPSCAPSLLKLVLPQFESYMNDICKIHQTAVPLPNSEMQEQEKYAVRDFSTCCKIVSTVAGRYYAQHNPEKAWEILRMFIDLALYVANHRLHTRAECFVAFQETVLESVRLSIGCIDTLLKAGLSNDVAVVADRIVNLVMIVLDTKIIASPESVMSSAVELLNAITWNIPSEMLHSTPSMQLLKSSAHTISLSLPLTIQANIYSSISISLLPPSLSSRTPAWTTRATAFNEFGSPIVASITEIASTLEHNDLRTVDPQILMQIRRDMRILEAMATAIRTAPKPAKDAYHGVVTPALPAAMSVLTMCLKQKQLSPPMIRVANEILSFYIRLLAAIRKELKSEFVGQTVTHFIALFQFETLTASLGNCGRTGTLFLYRFLEFLTIVMEEPTSVFSTFLQSILDLCFGTLKPLIFAGAHKGCLIPQFITLLHHVLEKHFRFFVVNEMLSNGARRKSFTSETARQYFNAIWEALGSTLQNPELPPRVVRQILALLERINEAHNLFNFESFQEGALMAFMQTFVELLLSGSMNLLRDEICSVIYHMASVDFNSFYQVFVPGFLNSKVCLQQEDKEKLYQVLGRENDEPSFKKNLIAFLNDSRYMLIMAYQ